MLKDSLYDLQANEREGVEPCSFRLCTVQRSRNNMETELYTNTFDKKAYLSIVCILSEQFYLPVVYIHNKLHVLVHLLYIYST